jgi:hypothetical protein
VDRSGIRLTFDGLALRADGEIAPTVAVEIRVRVAGGTRRGRSSIDRNQRR